MEEPKSNRAKKSDKDKRNKELNGKFTAKRIRQVENIIQAQVKKEKKD